MKKSIFIKIALCSTVLIIGLLSTMLIVLKNNLSPEETVSKFMYLIEHKEYEKARKLTSKEIEHLDLLSNIEPSKLTFEFSEDKKEAVSIVLEEDIEQTKLKVTLNKTIMGWKINDFSVKKDMVPSAIIQNKLEKGEEVSRTQFLHWALSDETVCEDISKYTDNNLVILTLFAEFMKDKKYDKAMGLYEIPSEELPNSKELKEKEIKMFDWNNYNISNDTELIGMNIYHISDNNNDINIMIDYNHKIVHIYKDK